ncbi:MAG: amidotransferase [Spirochaetes bacterium GWB1_36_13]|nr:MAG: amidotransferase [Spirochaetes bacterium GWB1_36_13]
MKFQVFKHAHFEGPANLSEWIVSKHHHFEVTHFYQNDPLPSIHDFDILIVMGGPMSVNDEETYPWLKDEKKLIKEAAEAGKKILGICLGAQLIASALGSKVYRNREKEIGWFPVSLTEEAIKNKFLASFPETFETFHWHGETFDIPENAIRIGESPATLNQGFVYKNTIALQFHPETSFESAKDFIRNCKKELVKNTFIQSGEEILQNKEKFQELKKTLYTFLDIFFNHP